MRRAALLERSESGYPVQRLGVERPDVIESREIAVGGGP